MSWAEIARRTGMSISAVQRGYHRAIEKLRIAFLLQGVTQEEFESYLRIRLTAAAEHSPEALIRELEERTRGNS